MKFEDNNFLDTIRNKMLWGIDKRNKTETENLSFQFFVIPATIFDTNHEKISKKTDLNFSFQI
jgi:hypothetical protein